MNKLLIVRANANTHIGTGHLMRCLALAQGWKARGGQTMFITSCESDSLRQRLSDEGFQVITVARSYPDPADWKATSEVLAVHPGAWVVLDGYHFDESYQQRVKEAGHRLLVIDDMARLEHYYADIVLNQNLHAAQLNYSCESYTRLLLGTRYVLLRREFLKWRAWRREIPESARKVLVTLGGGDPDNVTLKVIRALQQVDVEGLEVAVVVGAGNPHFGELQSAIRNPQLAIRLIQNVTDMPELMAWANVAVSAAGSTCWELAFMGLPSLLLALAENQRFVAEQMDATGAARGLGWHKDLTPDKIAQSITGLLTDLQERLEMARCSRGLVDGEGSGRVLMRLEDQRLRLKPVRDEDCRLLWEWANDPEVRSMAFSSEPILWEEHVQWLTRKLREPTCFLFVALDDQDTPVGQVRFDIDKGEEANIDVSIDRSKRRSGHGSLLINRAVEEIFRVAPVETVHALIKPHNKGSIKAFEKAKFRRLGMETVKGNVAIHYVRSRSDA